MGDSGAYMIGFVIAALSLINSEKGAVAAALLAPVLAWPCRLLMSPLRSCVAL